MFNERLNKRENAVMGAVFRLSGGKERFLVSLYEIIAILPPRASYGEEQVESTLRALELDGYFELIESDRKGEPVFVGHMREAGRSFRRSDALRKRRIYYKIAVTLLCGALSALVGILVKSLLG